MGACVCVLVASVDICMRGRRYELVAAYVNALAHYPPECDGRVPSGAARIYVNRSSELWRLFLLSLSPSTRLTPRTATSNASISRHGHVAWGCAAPAGSASPPTRQMLLLIC